MSTTTRTPTPAADPAEATATEDLLPQWSLEQPMVVALLITFILIVITSLYFIILGRKKGISIVFTGPTETGKTSIFVHLLNKVGKETVTSTVANVGEFQTQSSKQTLLLKDLPGHDRVRNKWWESHKSRLRGVVCVLDAAGGAKAIRDAADVLYTVLTDSVVLSLKPRVLILANKQDLIPAGREVNVRAQLEKELTTLKLTKSASLNTTGGGSTRKQLGKPDRDFDFDQVAPIKVDFGKSCAKPGSAQLQELHEWLEMVAR